MSYLVFHSSRNNPDCSFFQVWALWPLFGGECRSRLSIRGSLRIACPTGTSEVSSGYFWELLNVSVGMLILSICLSCQSMVSQYVYVESSSWFRNLNHQDHDIDVW